MAEIRNFQPVYDEPTPEPAAKSDKIESAALGVLTLALKALSQRAMIALDNLFTLITVGSAFWLWHSIPTPDAYQLVGLAMYGVFVLTANWIVRR